MVTKAGVWYRVSSDSQDSDNQVPDVEKFVEHHGYEVAEVYRITDSAWKNGGGQEYRRTLERILTDAHRGRFKVLVVWAADRICRTGIEDLLKIVRQLRERGCALVSVQEPWLNGTGATTELLLAIAAWVAHQESKRRSERTKAGLARKRAEDPEWKPGRPKGAGDKKPRRRSGYLRSWEEGARAALSSKRWNDAGRGQGRAEP
jgi:DNA invertase Pin-like site-specific DNA recombinase